MAKITLTDLANLSNPLSAVTNINANNAAIETAIEKTFSRDGTSPNQMLVNLDMNSFRVFNLPTPVSDNDAARMVDVNNAAFGHLVSFTALTISGGSPAFGASTLLLNQNATAVPANGILAGTTTHSVGANNSDTFEIWDCYGYNGTHIANPHLVTRTANGTQAVPINVGTYPATRDSQYVSPRDYCGTWAGIGYGTTGFQGGGGAAMSFCPTFLHSDTVGGMQARIAVTPNGTLNTTYAFIFDQDSSFTINRSINNITPPLPDNGGISPGLRIASADSGFDRNAFALLDTYGGQAGYLIRNTGGTRLAPTATQNGDQLGFIAAQGRGSTAYNSSSGVQLRMYAEQTWTDANQGTGLAVFITPLNTNLLAATARFWSSTGFSVGVGTGDPGAGVISALNAMQLASATAVPAGGTTGLGLKMSSTSNLGVFFGSGAPTLSAAKGSLYLRTDGSATNNRSYINTDGSTTWTAVITAA